MRVSGGVGRTCHRELPNNHGNQSLNMHYQHTDTTLLRDEPSTRFAEKKAVCRQPQAQSIVQQGSATIIPGPPYLQHVQHAFPGPRHLRRARGSQGHRGSALASSSSSTCTCTCAAHKGSRGAADAVHKGCPPGHDVLELHHAVAAVQAAHKEVQECINGVYAACPAHSTSGVMCGRDEEEEGGGCSYCYATNPPPFSRTASAPTPNFP